ncbi:MAG: zinc transport system substrate-binding protein [Campylobacterota bacterium]|nr:zinc transport system substrate-binding protein [Campylobacterota bacterium]
MSFKNRFFISFVAVIVLFTTFTYAKDTNKKPLIAASTFSLYDISKNIAKESAEVFMILPAGVSAHDYEPTPKEIIKISNSDLVLYSGAGLEPWVKGFSFKKRNIDMSKFVKLREIEEDEHEDEHHHSHGKTDPHYWQDIENMILASHKVTKELSELFPQNKGLYEKNRDAYIAMLQTLDEEYKKRLSSCKSDTIIVNHNAFSYLSARYGFYTAALSGLSPEAEPNAKTMIKLIDFIKKHKVNTIFYESFASDKAMKNIAKEAKVDAKILHPLGNITADEAKEKLTYEDIMRQNLQKISSALECK